MFKVKVRVSDSLFCNTPVGPIRDLVDITLENKNHKFEFVKKYRSSFYGKLYILYKAMESNSNYYNKDFPMVTRDGKFLIYIENNDDHYRFMCDNEEAKIFIRELMEIL